MSTISMTRQIMFHFLNGLLWPSIACTSFLFYHFIRSSRLRTKPRNRILICLLIVNFIQEILELPPRLYFLSTQIVLFPNPTFCLLWNWYQFTLVSINQFIMAIASIEHYLFIFHRIFLSQHIFLLQQLPLISCILLPASFYAVSIYIPSFFIQRQRRHNWQENIRMISQLIPLTILYLIIWIPMCILFYFTSIGTDTQKSLANLLINDYFGGLKDIINFFCPFLILINQRELYDKMKRIFFCLYYRPRQHVAVVRPLPN